MNPEDHFHRLLSYAVRQPNGCLRMTRLVKSNGYAKLLTPSTTPGRKQRVTGVHRIAYAADRGIPLSDVPEVLDHTCHNEDTSCPGGRACLHRACIEPSHLREATDEINIKAGRAGQAHANRTTCGQTVPEGLCGLALSGTNLLLVRTATGIQTRRCRSCHRRRTREAQQRSRARKRQRAA